MLFVGGVAAFLVGAWLLEYLHYVCGQAAHEGKAVVRANVHETSVAVAPKLQGVLVKSVRLAASSSWLVWICLKAFGSWSQRRKRRADSSTCKNDFLQARPPCGKLCNQSANKIVFQNPGARATRVARGSRVFPARANAARAKEVGWALATPHGKGSLGRWHSARRTISRSSKGRLFVI